MHGYLRHLANFARIVEAGSMKAASDALGISPSGLSDSVRVLENRLGAALLVRHKGGVTPTSDGERIYASASTIVDALHEAIGIQDGETLNGPCRLSVPTEVASTCIGPVIQHLKRTHPELSLKVFAEDELVDHSRFGRDYFLRVAQDSKTYPGLRTIWNGTANAILVASAALLSNTAAEDARAVARLPAIVGTERKPPYGFPLSHPDGRISFDTAISVSHPATQLSLAIQGHGLTGCLDICAADAIQKGQLRRVLAQRFSVPLEIRLMTPHRRKTPLDSALIEAMGALPRVDA